MHLHISSKKTLMKLRPLHPQYVAEDAEDVDGVAEEDAEDKKRASLAHLCRNPRVLLCNPLHGALTTARFQKTCTDPVSGAMNRKDTAKQWPSTASHHHDEKTTLQPQEGSHCISSYSK